MYALAIQQDFIARRSASADGSATALSHRYRVELMVEAEELDQQGYVVDIDELQAQFEGIVDEFRDKTLNELPDFEGVNPSLEHFARVLCEKVDEALYAPQLSAISIKLWEDDTAWVAYDVER
ncbi:MAG: 6-carboxytetrahydropterin synthase [Caldilineae bacterium]|nr:MAG: 6-carboxytetrahydropterin synthase [Caldilineae bacterium]